MERMMERILLIITLVSAALMMSCEEQNPLVPDLLERPAATSVLPGFSTRVITAASTPSRTRLAGLRFGGDAFPSN